MELPPPEPLSKHPVDVGFRHEMAVAEQFSRRGYNVLRPLGENQRYDLVLDVRGTFIRVQCKCGRLASGSFTFSTSSVRANMKGVFTRGYLPDEIDLFAVYSKELDRLFAIPIEVASRGTCTLRLEPTANNQELGIRWARDYEVPITR